MEQSDVIDRWDPYLWERAFVGLYLSGVPLINASWQEWSIEILYRQARIPEEQWPAIDSKLRKDELFAPDNLSTPKELFEVILTGINLALRSDYFWADNAFNIVRNVIKKDDKLFPIHVSDIRWNYSDHSWDTILDDIGSFCHAICSECIEKELDRFGNLHIISGDQSFIN